MIKKIQLRGISRTPSDRLTSDGGCAESLNVQLQAGEIAPMAKPVKAKDGNGNEINVSGDILYIHKGIGYENLIYQSGSELRYSVILPKGEGTDGLVYDGFEAGEEINDITAIGNTLIISSTKDMYYILWKEGSYRLIGNQIPVPSIGFRIGELSSPREVPVVEDFDDPPTDTEFGLSRLGDDMVIFPHENIGDVTNYGYSAKKYVFDPDFQNGFWNEFLDLTWGEIDRQLADISRSGKAVFPMFVRYAVRLYDGTHYAQSIPVLLGADIEKFVDEKGVVFQGLRISGDGTEKHVMTVAATFVKLAEPYSIVIDEVSGDLYEGWEDIVKSVDIFVSPQMKPVQRNAARFDMKYARQQGTPGAINTGANWYKIDNFVLDPFYMEENQEKLVLNHQNTFLAKSFTLEEFGNLSSGYVLDIDTSSDYILVQEALKETPRSMHHTKGNGLFNYNKRLLMTDTEQVLYGGYPFIHSSKWIAPSNPTQARYGFVFYLRGENGENIVVTKNVNGGEEITARRRAIVEGSQDQYEEFPTAWFAYPDSRCYRMEIYMYSWQTMVASLQMRPLDQADVAYAFIGFGQQRGYSLAMYRPSENNLYKQPNTLLVSKANNPFVFPVEDSVTFTAGEILNLAVATKALSEGQFGQFPLYVFTDEGVFALSVGDEGQFRNAHTVSRDILISSKAVAGIEQGVFFAAARGLLLLQGSTVTKVSDAIEGPVFDIDPVLADKLSADHFDGMQLEPAQPFHQFLKGCHIAYDYASSRIILMNDSYRTMYVYKFDTNTWHRMNMGLGTPVRVLNSFPEAAIVIGDQGGQSLYNFSVVLESEGTEVAPGLIFTRSFDLGESDVRKIIRSLRIRGMFNRGDARYILLGSFDGIHWKQLPSLHGGSYKMFSMILLTNLSPGERISWVDIDYETRFTNKLR